MSILATPRPAATEAPGATPATRPAATPAATRARSGLGRGFGRGFGRLVWTEAKVWSRGLDPFWVAFPALLLGLMAVAVPAMRQPLTGSAWAGTSLAGVAALNLMIPPFIAMTIGMTSLSIMPVTFGGFREKGVLRRFSATPMRPRSLFAAHFIINTAMALAGSILAVVLVAALFPMAMPNSVAIVFAGFVLGMAALMALGSLISAVVPKASAGTALGNIVYFPLLLVSGVFAPLPPGSAIWQIGRFTPMGAAAQVMSYGWFGGDVFPWLQLAVLAVWTAVLGPLAVKLFRWS